MATDWQSIRSEYRSMKAGIRWALAEYPPLPTCNKLRHIIQKFGKDKMVSVLAETLENMPPDDIARLIYDILFDEAG